MPADLVQFCSLRWFVRPTFLWDYFDFDFHFDFLCFFFYLSSRKPFLLGPDIAAMVKIRAESSAAVPLLWPKMLFGARDR